MPDLLTTARRPKGDVGLLIVALVAVVAGTACYVVKGPEIFFSVLGGDLTLLLSIAPKVIGGVLLAGLLTVLLPQDKVARWMGARSGLRGLVLAGLAGALLPGGPMMAFPLTVALRGAGADIGTTTAFLTGWALLNLNRTLVWEMSFFGHDFVFLRYGLSLAVPLLLGLAARLIFAAAAAAGKEAKNAQSERGGGE
ncbi:permease [Pelagibius marinus]|uniref:permease n=1 Tax=Pelagibius marinus TaxID=2762760 RepID=UPI0018723D98|nr:permease [Pelagibius marinus]